MGECERYPRKLACCQTHRGIDVPGNKIWNRSELLELALKRITLCSELQQDVSNTNLMEY